VRRPTGPSAARTAGRGVVNAARFAGRTAVSVVRGAGRGFDAMGRGIASAAAWAGRGIASAASAVGRGLRTAGGWVWEHRHGILTAIAIGAGIVASLFTIGGIIAAIPTCASFASWSIGGVTIGSLATSLTSFGVDVAPFLLTP